MDRASINPLPIAPPAKFPDLNGGSWEAIRTDHAHGSGFIYFNVDEQFMNGGRNLVVVKVTYIDDHAGEWRLEYDAGAEAVWKRSKPVLNRQDGKWKTVTLQRDDAEHDLTVRFVGLIKAEPPARAPARPQPESEPTPR